MTTPMRLEGEIAFEVTSVSPERTLGEMPVQPGILNPFGTVHAGALIWFADVLATRHVFGDGEVETRCEDGTVYADGRCEYFAGLSPQRKAELIAARDDWG